MTKLPDIMNRKALVLVMRYNGGILMENDRFRGLINENINKFSPRLRRRLQKIMEILELQHSA